MRLRVPAGGLLLIAAVVQLTVVQIVVAAAWPRPYDWNRDFISDLGNTACGPFAVDDARPSYVCSPEHGWMNASFIAFGLLTIAAAVVLVPLRPRGRLTGTAFWVWLLAGAGAVLVGLAPENQNSTLHVLGALNIPLTSIAILLVGLALRRSRPLLAALSAALGVAGLVGIVLQGGATDHLIAGLGVGGWERVAVHSSNLWTLAAGLLVIRRRPTAGS